MSASAQHLYLTIKLFTSLLMPLVVEHLLLDVVAGNLTDSYWIILKIKTRLGN